MARLSKTAGKTSQAKTRRASRPAKGRKTTKPRIAPKARQVKRGSVPGPNKDLKQAYEQQAATAEILKVIASSPHDVQPVFDAIAESARRLLASHTAVVTRVIHDVVHLAASTAENEAPAHAEQGLLPYPLSSPRIHAKVARTGQLAISTDAPNSDLSLEIKEFARTVGWRSMLVVPMLRNGIAIGTIGITRREAGPFDDRTIDLLKIFADQAVIAIENTRLFNETQEALEQQTATADILKVIASSPGDLAPVFDAMLESAMRLCEASHCHIWRFDSRLLHAVAMRGDPWFTQWLQKNSPIAPIPGSAADRIASGEDIVHVGDRHEEEAYFSNPVFRDLVDASGMRTSLSVALRRDGILVGMINVYRQEVRPFSDRQLALLQNFAAQAVIAMENARLFNETREALERQTATADILKVIASSPDDVQPVFQAIADRSNRLVNALSTTVFRLDGDMMQLRAFTPTTPEADATLQATFPARLSTFSWGESIRRGEIYRVIDAEQEPAGLRDLARQRGWRSCLCVPLLRDGKPIGMIGPTRAEPGQFADHHVQLLQTFADQAVIAISNVRLFDEVQARTRDLTEALTYQTGSSNILQVIASSPTDVGPVLKVIVESACGLCEAHDAVVVLKDGNDLEARAHHGPIPLNQTRWTNDRTSISGRAIADRLPIHLHDILSDEGLEFETAREMSRRDGCHTILGVPMLREGVSIGAIALRRIEVRPFDDKQIALLQTFADQAVIALGNVRLFEQVQERTRDLTESLQFQTASSDVLKVISRSPDTLQPVLDVICETSRELCDSDASTIFLLHDNKFHFTAISGTVPQHIESLRTTPREIGHPGSVFTHVAQQKRTLHYPNIADDPELLQGTTSLGGPRALLMVPLMQDNEVIGTIVLRQSIDRPFTPRQIQAIETFADQAVIAISNVNLFEQVQQRTRELSKSLDDLRTAQGRLIQTEKLASLGQLTAGIAHEIKNPLNFVNNFSALSAELTDELKDVLMQEKLSDKGREQVDELTGLLNDNLGKVVQHGKRADSIVKNMLLHSREGSGEHRLADINALVEESLNLAYHGARAEKSGFNITLTRDLAPDAGAAELYPQEITRALLNLISNGFYAATKRKSEVTDESFEPRLSAATKNLGNTVEIRIRDNGTGIPHAVKEKMFNPFFTTKPAGEGTGLGLSMSHDIVVKQHGGRIDVETEHGVFTEFIITLPRNGAAQTPSRR